MTKKLNLSGLLELTASIGKLIISSVGLGLVLWHYRRPTLLAMKEGLRFLGEHLVNLAIVAYCHVSIALQ